MLFPKVVTGIAKLSEEGRGSWVRADVMHIFVSGIFLKMNWDAVECFFKCLL